MKKFLITSILFLNAICVDAQSSIEWQKSFGGIDEDAAESIQQTIEGGYIVAGISWSSDGDVIGNHGVDDFWILKLNNSGNIEWQKSLGGTDYDFAFSIQQTTDSGYIVGGGSHSNDGDVTGNHSGTNSSSDYWIVKLNISGTIEWQKSLGGTSSDIARTIQQTTDGGYIVGGESFSNDSDVTGHHGALNNSDYWIVKINSSGIIEWQKSLGGIGSDIARSIQQTTDGGYIIGGESLSNDGDVTGHHGTLNHSDYWVVKISSVGVIEWQKSSGGTGVDVTYSTRETNDGGYIVAGYTDSNDGDVTGNHGGEDCWLVKLNGLGIIEWQKTFGGADNDESYCIKQTTDGGYVIGGFSYSNDGDVAGNHGADFWIFKINGTGDIQWQKCLGGIAGEIPFSIQQTAEGGYIVAGYSESSDGDVTSNHGGRDYWIVKLSASVGINEINPENYFEIFPNPSDGNVTVQLSEQCKNCRVIIFNQLGQELYSEILNQKSQLLNLKHLPQGIYFVKVQMQNGDIELKKFIKQ